MSSKLNIGQQRKELLTFKISNAGARQEILHNGDKVCRVDLRSIPQADLKIIKSYFFDTGVFCSQLYETEAESAIFYSHFATCENDYNKIMRLLTEKPLLKEYYPHIFLIIGYAALSHLDPVKKSDDVPKNPNTWNNFDRQRNLKKEVEGIKMLYERLLERQNKSANQDLACCISTSSYKFKRLAPNSSAPKPITIESVQGENTLLLVLKEFVLKLKEENKTLDDYFYSYYKQKLPPRNRPRKIHQVFCQQFFKFFNENTPFNTQNELSENDLLKFFIEIYELCGYRIKEARDWSGTKLDMVRKWYKPTISKKSPITN